MKLLPSFITFSDYKPVDSIVIIGCGGTGGYVIGHLARFLSAYSSVNKREIHLTLVDGDIVEEKNLLRQNFISRDITKNKAITLGERYSGAFGIKINVLSEDIESVDKLNSLIKGSTPLVVGCVDNNASRKILSDWINSSRNYTGSFWLDCGNEERSGQVVCGFHPGKSKTIKIKDSGPGQKGVFSLPTATEVYPDLLTNIGRFNSELSCAERSVSAPQNIQTNITISTLALNYIQKLVLGEPLKNHAVDFSIDNVFSTRLNTYENLMKVDNSRKVESEK